MLRREVDSRPGQSCVCGSHLTTEANNHKKAGKVRTSINVRVFLRSPEVPGFWPSIGAVSLNVTARGSDITPSARTWPDLSLSRPPPNAQIESICDMHSSQLFQVLSSPQLGKLSQPQGRGAGSPFPSLTETLTDHRYLGCKVVRGLICYKAKTPESGASRVLRDLARPDGALSSAKSSAHLRRIPTLVQDDSRSIAPAK